jgi:hypothetical protein
MAIQIGKYKRPGIFLEEFDRSIISSPIVEGITNLVIGVSKKGPINTPIRVSTVQEFESIFGQLDRGLERKGSFFHRTVAKMLETSPVFAMNLLYTDDELDRIEYQSLSAASAYDNDIEREGPYRRFFDTTGFWKKDTETFINLTKNNTGYAQRALSITNMSDRYVSVFIFKSKLTGFDRTLLEWYGSIEKMPTYVNPNDFASDYLVDVVIVAGDWSNYQELSVDNRWSAYFNSTGLRKDQVSNFANDRNVTALAYYEGLSLIPYFRDLNGRNLFIETTINRDTDRTGVFCAFNNDLVEKDYYNGLLDLLGNTLVDAEENNINFLSYRETITESVSITNTPLDLPGNVTAMLGDYNGYGTYSYSQAQADHAFADSSNGIGPATTLDPAVTSGIVNNEGNRTAWFSEAAIYGVDLNNGTPSVVTGGGTNSAVRSVTYNIANGSFAIIGDTYVTIQGTAAGSAVLEIDASDYTYSATTASYTSAFVLDTTGTIQVVTSLVSGTNPAVQSSDLVLGYVEFQVVAGTFGTVNAVQNVSINTSGFNDYSYGTASGDDYYISEVNPGTNDGLIKVEFTGTNTAQSVTNYKQYRRFRLFNRLSNLIDSPNKNRMSLMLNPITFEKYSFENIEISSIVTSTTQNKSFILSTGLTTAELQYILDGYFVIYTEDNEFMLGEEGVKTQVEPADASTYGVVGKYSTFYQRYFDGLINTKDYFYSNRLWLSDSAGSYNANTLGTSVDITFIDGESATSATSSYAGYDYVIFYSDVANFSTQIDLQTFEQLQFPDSTLNTGSYTIVANSVAPSASPNQLAIALGFTGSNYYAYQVNEEVEYEVLTDVVRVNDYLVKHYLKMYLDNNDLLIVDFLNSDFSADSDVDTRANNTFFIQSEKSNYKQTLELEVPTGYVQIPNKCLVVGDRYTEVKVGDFLEAYYDTTALQTGEFPRKLTRILSKRAYAGDPTLTEITCDARIATRFSGGALQTTRFVTIDQYATTYKALSLKGFRIRQASLPDGTETRQNQILNLVAKGTPLFKALTNKEAIDFRYLIDCFGLGLIEKSKQQLVDICGDRLDCFGFINMPSARLYKNSSSPTFVNAEGVLQMEYVASGGNPESNPAFLYSFADGPGSTCVGYFFPYVTIGDNGRPLEHPPAPFVATTYMRKHVNNLGNITPWTIAAGVTNGRIIGILSLEQDLTQTDIEFLNQAQINPLVFKRNRGYIIETENTGQTLYKSALSYIHVREVLIELERELSRMLLDFQWRFNTPDVRSEIKLRADVICEGYVSKNGLYNYFNKMDEENNTPDLIDNQIGVLDTYVEPIKGMGIIVNNITILRTGAIAAGGFITS